jgi:hypothetical protein
MNVTAACLAAWLLASPATSHAADRAEADFAAMSPEQIRQCELDVMRRVADLALISPNLNTSPLPQYDYDRLDDSRTGERNVLMATFREEDAAAGKEASKDVRLRQLVSKASGKERKWQTRPATDDGTTVRAELPANRPLAYFLTLTDERKATVRTERESLSKQK